MFQFGDIVETQLSLLTIEQVSKSVLNFWAIVKI